MKCTLRLALGLALASSLAAGCGQEPRSRTFTIGGPGGTNLGQCRITDNGNGSATITCADGTSITLRNGTRCTVTTNADTSVTLSCDDGTSATLHNGKDGRSCTVIDNKDGTKKLSCDDGTSVTISDGKNGRSCTVAESGGVKTISCDDGTSVQVTDGKSADQPLLRLDDEAAGSHCAAGGVAVRSGLDTNRNGQLEDSEVTSTKYVCNGTAATTPGVRFEGDYTITNSADLLLFANVEEVTGSLIINAPAVTSVELLRLKKVGGNLVVSPSVKLASCRFPVLTEVAGLLDVSMAQALDTLDLSSLTKVGTLRFYALPKIASLTGVFGSLSEVVADLIIFAVPLVDLAGLGSLTHVGGALKLQTMPALTSLTGLTALAQVDGTLTLEKNPILTNLTGMPSLTKIGGTLMLTENSTLTSLAGMTALTQIGGALVLEKNAALTSMTGIPPLTKLGGLGLWNNPVLTSITGLQNLTQIGGLGILGNPKLVSLAGLGTITSIDSGITINGSALTNLSGLDAVTSVGGSVEILNNTQLTSLAGLNKVTSISGRVIIEGNQVLDSLSALGALKTVTGATTFDLMCLCEVHWGTHIRKNPKLTSLGLSSLNNPGLKLEIYYNLQLPACTAKALLTQVQAAGWTGETALSDNLGTCP